MASRLERVANAMYRDVDPRALYARRQAVREELAALDRRLAEARQTHLPVLPAVDSSAPCAVPWAQMERVQGESADHVRRCVQCNAKVFDLCGLDAERAAALIERGSPGHAGRAPHRRHDGTVTHRDCDGERRHGLAMRGVFLVAWLGVPISILMGACFAMATPPTHGPGYPVRQSRWDAATLASISSQFLVENDGRCPTVGELHGGMYVSTGTRTRDGWDREFRIDCVDNAAVVVSAGLDGVFDTADDISNLSAR